MDGRKGGGRAACSAGLVVALGMVGAVVAAAALLARVASRDPHSKRVPAMLPSDDVIRELLQGNDRYRSGKTRTYGLPLSGAATDYAAAVLEDPSVYVGDQYTVDFSLTPGGSVQYQITGANLNSFDLLN